MEMLNRILYKYSNMDGSSQILIFLIVLVFLMLISIVIINIITRKKKGNNDIISNKKIVKLSSELDLPFKDTEEVIEKIETKEEPIEEIKDEEVVEVRVGGNTSLDEITDLIENTLEQKPIDLTKFEEDQEENAIISYDELVKRAGAKKIIYKCEDVKPKEEIVKQEEPKEKAKFKASRVISPIYGVQKEEVEDKDEVIESFIELEKAKEENKEDIETLSDMEFLGSLKKFRSEL